MLGKTFKGMTDELLRWQTEHFAAIATSRDQHTVHVQPTTVVEIACDGLQQSTRYPVGWRCASPGCSATARTRRRPRRTRWTTSSVCWGRRWTAPDEPD